MGSQSLQQTDSLSPTSPDNLEEQQRPDGADVATTKRFHDPDFRRRTMSTRRLRTVVITKRAPPRLSHSLFKFMGAAIPTALLLAFLINGSIKAQQEKPPWGVLTTLQTAGLPSEAPWPVQVVESTEDQTRPTVQQMKSQLAQVVQDVETETPPMPTPRAEEIMLTLAKAVSQGRSNDLIGMKVNLTDLRRVGSGSEVAGSQEFLVKQYVGEGSGSVVLEVVNWGTLEVSAMRIKTIQTDLDLGDRLWGSPVRAYLDDIVRSTQGALQVCRGTPLYAAASEKGIAVSQAVAQIQDVPDIIVGENVSVLSMVELMPRLHADLRSVLLAEKTLSTGWKSYVAQRVLKTVLQLQRAGLSHNQIHSSSFLFDSSGSPLLTGFGSSVPFGRPVSRDMSFFSPCLEPELAVELDRCTRGKRPPRAEPKSDMWSLGVLLYEIMTEGGLPFGLDGLSPSTDPAPFFEQLLKEAVPDGLHASMVEHGTSDRWEKLICKLLQPKRNKRISAEQVVAEFQDLLSFTHDE